jgi:PHD/YefM family antitoxin component YafN of YafNO toxin-antitoxin module
MVTVHPVAEVRSQLSAQLARFRREGDEAKPVVFGSHRRPEAVIVPYEQYEALVQLAAAEHRRTAHANALASVRAEGFEVSPEHLALVEDHVGGRIGIDELYEEVLRRHRRS